MRKGEQTFLNVSTLFSTKVKIFSHSTIVDDSNISPSTSTGIFPGAISKKEKYSFSQIL